MDGLERGLVWGSFMRRRREETRKTTDQAYEDGKSDGVIPRDGRMELHNETNESLFRMSVLENGNIL